MEKPILNKSSKQVNMITKTPFYKKYSYYYTITWNNGVDVDFYELYSSNDNVNFTKIETFSKDDIKSYNVSSVGNDCYYKIKAFNF